MAKLMKYFEKQLKDLEREEKFAKKGMGFRKNYFLRETSKGVYTITCLIYYKTEVHVSLGIRLTKPKDFDKIKLEVKNNEFHTKLLKLIDKSLDNAFLELSETGEYFEAKEIRDKAMPKESKDTTPTILEALELFHKSLKPKIKNGNFQNSHKNSLKWQKNNKNR
jgi:hypothetical protein